jgi:two-component system chemotaxis response regulator CheB
MVERALWIALRTLQERAILLTRMAVEAQRRGFASAACGFEERRQEIEENLRTIRGAISVVTHEVAPPIAAPAIDG